jgi:GNAT superfamily N-acetyltransferase
MRPGRREYRDASLVVSLSSAVPEHMRDRVREITRVFVPVASRGQRMATALLNFICQEADANKITLILTARSPEAVEGEDDSRLVAWYECFGFVSIQQTDDGTLMARQVREKQRIKPLTLAVSAALSKALH